jgi:cell division transport system permease protein
MVGATNSFIRLPFVVEGFTLGMIGAGISFGLLWMLYDWARKALASVEALPLLTLQPFQDLWALMLVTFAAAGLFVGIVGSWTSIRKFMNV